MEALAFERTLTDLDHRRLLNLWRRGGTADGHAALQRPLHAPIEQLLDISAVVPSRQVQPDVVTMYSQVEVQALDTGSHSTLTVCYPADAEPATGFVSVLSPVGSSLLGLSVGDVAHWSTPAGAPRGAKILAMLFQPESSGDYTT